MRIVGRAVAVLLVASIAATPRPATADGPVVQPPGEIFHVSADPSGGDHDGLFARDAVASAEGRFIAFASDAPDLVADDTNGRSDVFVWSRTTGRTERVSLSTGGGEANGFSSAPSISADGRYVLFTSTAADLVLGDANGLPDAFLRDRVLGTTERIQTAEGPCRSVMSADGRFVLCDAKRPGLFNGRIFQFSHALVLDRATGDIEFASVRDDGQLAQRGVANPSDVRLSANGRYVAFTSSSTELYPGFLEGSIHVFVRDLVADRTWIASVNNAGEPAIYRPWKWGINTKPSVADNGRVVFESFNDNIAPTSADTLTRAYVHDPVTRTTTLAVTSLTGGRPATQTQWPAISPDGRRVAVTSIGNDLLPNTGFAWRIVMRDLETDALVDVTATHDGSPPISISQDARFSPDGSAVAFMSRSSNLTPGLSGTSRHRSYLRLVTPAAPPKPNTVPAVSAGGDVRIPQGGGTVSRQGIFSDPDEGQTWSADVDYGDGSGVAVLALAPDRTFQLSHAYGGAGPFDVRVTVRDSAGGVGTGGFRVTVNRPPTVDAGQDAGTFPWTLFERTGTFSDPDAGQAVALSVDYGDGTPAAPLVPVPGLSSAFRLSHVYERTGTFTVAVTATDDLGGRGTSSFGILVSPARSFIFVHGITGSFREASFETVLTPLRATYRGIDQIRRFEYWQDVGRARDGSTVCDPAKERRLDFDPSADPHGLPLTLTERSLSETICDSQSDVGINAMLLGHDIVQMHGRFGGKVTIVANSMGGAITRAYLAFAAASQAPSLDLVDEVVFIQGAQQGSFTTYALPVLSTALGPAGGTVMPSIAAAVRERSRYDALSPAFDDLTPVSEMYRWVNPDAEHVPAGITYVNVASDIHLVVGADVFGLARISLADVAAGDYVMLPGSDDPRAVPLLGGERFDPRTIGRGAAGSTQYVLHRDVLLPMELFRAVIERGPSVTVDDVLDRILVPEWHGAIGAEMARITVREGDSLRSLDQALVDRIRSLGP